MYQNRSKNNPSMQQRRLFLAVTIACSSAIVSAFISPASLSLTSTQARHFANFANTSFRPKAKASKGAKKGGGGFGGSSSSSGGFGSKNKTTQGKVRSVSGYTGSGTKPLRVAANTFDKIRKKYGKECCNDLYVRTLVNDSTTFWFVGKLARRTDADDKEMQGGSIPTENEAALSQKRLIFEYAKKLRPQNLDGPYAKELELWLAPPDSEMDVVQNKVSLTKVLGSTSDISDTFSVADVGYNPEIYVGDEVNEGGLRVTRDEEGNPVKPAFEINN